MNSSELGRVIDLIVGYWPASNERATAMARWLHERGVTEDSAKTALGDLAEQYDQLPSIKQLGVKLAELGASTKAEIGVGNPVVVDRMKTRILEFAQDAAGRRGQTLNERLREEQAAVSDYLGDAIQFGLDDETVGWYRDQQTAIRELLATHVLKGPTP